MTFTLPRKSGGVVIAAYLLAYVALDWVSYVAPYGPLGITPWNPPPGLSVFVVMRYGPTMVPWVFAAALLAEVLVRGIAAAWPVVLLACAWLAVGYAGATLLLQRVFKFDGTFGTLRDATIFAGTAVVATLGIGLVYIGIFAAAGVVPAEAFLRTVGQFWIGDVIGIVVTTPLLLVFTRRRPGAPSAGRLETAAQGAAILIALWVVFGSGLGTELKLFYILFLPLIWITMRRGMAGTTLATVTVQVGLITALLLGGHGPAEVLDFQFLMLALALTGLFLGVTVEERRAAESKLRDKQFELDRSLRAAAASELASALAHELNQPLSAIASYTRSCQLLLESGDPHGELPATMSKVVSEAARAGTVVHRLREFVRSGTIRKQVLAPASILQAVAESAQPRAARHAVAVRTELSEAVPAILADRVEVELVLHNLVANAIDALKGISGERVVVVSLAPHDEDFVRFTVADNGPGVEAGIADTLFEPLASNKPAGLGLGLAISRTIVEAHGGTLWLAPSDKGASFCLTLPVAK